MKLQQKESSSWGKQKSSIRRGRNYGKKERYGRAENGRKRWRGKYETEKMRLAEKEDKSKR